MRGRAAVVLALLAALWAPGPARAQETDACAVPDQLAADGNAAGAELASELLADTCPEPVADVGELAAAFFEAALEELAGANPDAGRARDLLAAARLIDPARFGSTEDEKGPDLAGALLAAAEDELDGEAPSAETAQLLLDQAKEIDQAAGEPTLEGDDVEALQGRIDALENRVDTFWDRITDDLAPVLLTLAEVAVAVLVVWLVIVIVRQIAWATRQWRRNPQVMLNAALALGLLGLAPVAMLGGWPEAAGWMSLALISGSTLYRWSRSLVVGHPDRERWFFLLAGVIALGGGLVAVRWPDGWWFVGLAMMAAAVVPLSLFVHGPAVRFRIEPFAGDAGVTPLLEGWVRHFGSSQGPTELKRYEPPEDALEAIPETVATAITGASSLIKAVGDALARLVPDRSYHLSGTLHESHSGHRLSLVLRRGRRFVAGTLGIEAAHEPKRESKKQGKKQEGEKQEDDKPGGVRPGLQRVALLGAVWVGLALQEDAWGGGVAPLYGSRNWESAGMAALAVESHRVGGLDSAARRLRCVAALENDPHNWVATYELAQRDIEEFKHRQAIERLSRSRLRSPPTRGPGGTGAEMDVYHWYRVTYSLSLAHLHAHSCNQGRCGDKGKVEDGQDHLVRAKALANELIVQCKAALDAEPSDALQHFLKNTVLGPTKLMLAHTLILQGQATAAQLVVEEVLGEAGDAEGRPALSMMTRYNLACVYAEMSEQSLGKRREAALAESLLHLEYAFDGGQDLVDWATKDPTLRPLRARMRPRLAKLLKPHQIEFSEELELFGLAGLTKDEAEQLALNAIMTRADLVACAGSQSDRWELEAQTGIDGATIGAAARLADLAEQIPAAKPYLKLLLEAGLGSIARLRAWPSHSLPLRKELELVRVRSGGAGKLPAPHTLEAVLTAASQAVPRVDG